MLGCSQTHYRKQADQEAYQVIAERNHDSRWAVGEVSIDSDPRSRFYDDQDPDDSPMPVDDPASNQYMRKVDQHEAWKGWSEKGIRSSLENPVWREQLQDYAEVDDEGTVGLSIDSALRLAYLHSPLHQSNLETLYLSSLDVTAQRFRLDTQFFGGSGTNYVHRGDINPVAITYSPPLGDYVVAGPFSSPEANRFSIPSEIQARRRLATAGEVLVGFANSFTWDFTGSDASLGSSLANFSFVQPLLRGAGKKVALEQLTLSERRLLANLRAYAQFRQGFFTQVVIGELGVSGPQRFGTSTQLQSFSGVGGVGGYLGLLQQSQQIRNTEENLRLQLRTRDRLEALYDNELIDIVQVDQFRQNIEVTRANLLDQTNSLELSIDNYKTQVMGLPSDLAMVVDETLVEDFQLIPLEANEIVDSLLQLQKDLSEIGQFLDMQERLSLVEQWVADLGALTTEDASVAIQDLQRLVQSLSNVYSLQNPDGESSQAVMETLGSLRTLDAQLEQLVQKRLLALANAATSDPGSSQSNAAEPTSDATDSDAVDSATTITTEGESVNANVAKDDATSGETSRLTDQDQRIFQAGYELCTRLIQQRSEQVRVSEQPALAIQVAKEQLPLVEAMRELADAEMQRLEQITPLRQQTMTADEISRFRDDKTRLQERLKDLSIGGNSVTSGAESLALIESQLQDRSASKTMTELTAWIQDYLQVVERLALIPAQARLEVITVAEVELSADDAFEVALQNRLDFMNGRAALVDRWRAIEIAANELESNLSITGNWDIGTARNNMLDFRGGTSNLQLGVEFDAPLARLLERNGYRETLIAFQRSRREFIQSRDSLQKGLRALLRTLKQRRLQLEIQRRAVSIALRRVEQTQLSLLTPPPPIQPGSRPQINPTTAINLLGAQSSLQTSQNSFLAAWLNYYAARLRLYRELGVMELDSEGNWIENPLLFEEMTADPPNPPNLSLADSVDAPDKGAAQDWILIPSTIDQDSANTALADGDEGSDSRLGNSSPSPMSRFNEVPSLPSRLRSAARPTVVELPVRQSGF